MLQVQRRQRALVRAGQLDLVSAGFGFNPAKPGHMRHVALTCGPPQRRLPCARACVCSWLTTTIDAMLRERPGP